MPRTRGSVRRGKLVKIEMLVSEPTKQAFDQYKAKLSAELEQPVSSGELGEQLLLRQPRIKQLVREYRKK